jgi:hypothetical protein
MKLGSSQFLDWESRRRIWWTSVAIQQLFSKMTDCLGKNVVGIIKVFINTILAVV